MARWTVLWKQSHRCRPVDMKHHRSPEETSSTLPSPVYQHYLASWLQGGCSTSKLPTLSQQYPKARRNGKEGNSAYRSDSSEEGRLLLEASNTLCIMSYLPKWVRAHFETNHHQEDRITVNGFLNWGGVTFPEHLAHLLDIWWAFLSKEEEGTNGFEVDNVLCVWC